MGLSFHYSGQLAKPEYLPEIIEEVKQVCEVYKWKYIILNPAFPEESDFSQAKFIDNIYGIIFSPPGCETVAVSFLSNGKMSSPWLLKFYENDKQSNATGILYKLSVKTQFSNPGIHMVLIKLFRYLSERYFFNFQMIDEAEYWETNNENVLNRNFAKYNTLFDNFSLGLASIAPKKEETLVNYLTRIADRIQKLK